MKYLTLLLLCFCSFLPLASAQNLQEIPTILQKVDASDPENPTMRFLWRTDPGVRYLLKHSTDMETWTDVAGYPITADAPVEYFDFDPTASPKGFYKVFRMDEQAPVIVKRFPEVDGFAVPRFADIHVKLEDFSGIDPASISLTVGSVGPLTLASEPNLTFVDNVLIYDVVDTAHGAYGEEINVSLSVADTLGNAQTFTWKFTLDREAVLKVPEASVFVFGSAAAQRSGQRLTARQRLVAHAIVGAVRVPASGGSYELTTVAADRLVLTLNNITPKFNVNDIVSNTAPTSPDEVFYRRITSVSAGPSSDTLTLFTESLTLVDLIEDKGITLNENSIILGDGASPAIRAKRSASGSIDFPAMLNISRERSSPPKLV